MSEHRFTAYGEARAFAAGLELPATLSPARAMTAGEDRAGTFWAVHTAGDGSAIIDHRAIASRRHPAGLAVLAFTGCLWIAAALAIVGGLYLLGGLSGPAIAPCAEHAVLVGVGDFDGQRWTAYACGPARDDIR